MSTEPDSGATREFVATNATATPAPHTANALSAFARDRRRLRWPSRSLRPFLVPSVGILAIACIVIAVFWLRGDPHERAVAAGAAPPRPEGRLLVESRPSGAQVEIDGRARGLTPVALAVPAGRHVLAVTGATRRQMDVVVKAGADVVHHVELPDVVTSLRVETVPAGAAVTVDGRRRGTSPLDVSELLPGRHTIVVSSGDATVTRSLDLRPGVANSVVIALASPAGPASGWLAVTAPIDLEISDDGQVVGKGRTTRVLLTAGRHELSLVNRELGYADTRTVNIVANRTANVSVQPGTGVMYLNAIPWAEVFLDGRRIGETPIANFPAALGSHELLFRHPDLGEQRRTVVVALTAPARVGVSFKQ